MSIAIVFLFKGSKFKRVVILSSVGDNFKGSDLKHWKWKYMYMFIILSHQILTRSLSLGQLYDTLHSWGCNKYSTGQCQCSTHSIVFQNLTWLLNKSTQKWFGLYKEEQHIYFFSKRTLIYSDTIYRMIFIAECMSDLIVV